jgi:hypothetical protein
MEGANVKRGERKARKCTVGARPIGLRPACQAACLPAAAAEEEKLGGKAARHRQLAMQRTGVGSRQAGSGLLAEQ